jgi:hypothetical protein
MTTSHIVLDRTVKGLRVTAVREASRYVVTTSTGHRADLPACDCGRETCSKLTHRESYSISCRKCHNWHDGMVEAFVAAVAKTRTTKHRPPTPGCPRGSVAASDFVLLPIVIDGPLRDTRIFTIACTQVAADGKPTPYNRDFNPVRVLLCDGSGQVLRGPEGHQWTWFEHGERWAPVCDRWRKDVGPGALLFRDEWEAEEWVRSTGGGIIAGHRGFERICLDDVPMTSIA